MTGCGGRLSLKKTLDTHRFDHKWQVEKTKVKYMTAAIIRLSFRNRGRLQGTWFLLWSVLQGRSHLEGYQITDPFPPLSEIAALSPSADSRGRNEITVTMRH
ncbi:pr126 [rat cytomegalovirus strain Maastricht]|uniref:Pr126 n=1 Tax=Rat cytomegalovirus (strain Maastricht) TaxID=79700 RepID=Q9DW65_RCMVM|nr:pr126 [rat cytomegalovirus strain Maastricht]AAF99225.1 pr126 [rat cytomegalovirus strain Maastricht]